MTNTHNKLSREENAEIEIGHTTVSPIVAWTLSIAFIATLVLIPALQTITDLHKQKRPQACNIFFEIQHAWHVLLSTPGTISRFKHANATLLEGINRYQDQLDHNSILRHALPHGLRHAMISSLGQGNEQAYPGRQGWLYYRCNIDYLTSPPFLSATQLKKRLRSANEYTQPPQPDPRKAIIDFASQLQARGITLIIVPAPTKPSIHPEFFSRRFLSNPSPVQNPSFHQFKQELQDNGVLLYDPAPALLQSYSNTSQPQFLRTDTHWTPDAVDKVAQELALFIRRKTTIKTFNHTRLLRTARNISGQGDTAVMLQVASTDPALYPQEELQLQQVRTPNGAFWQPDPKSEILMLGDSYCNIYSLAAMKLGQSAGLPEQLSFHLSKPLDTILRNDSGAFATRQMLSRDLAMGIDRLAGKKLVIWQFAARELTHGNWKQIDMTLGSNDPSDFLLPQTDTTLTVRGTIRSLSHVPRPGTVTYRDHVMTIHLVNIGTPDNRPLDNHQAVVATFSMINDILTPAASYRPGTDVTLHLRNWQDVAPLYQSLNRSELSTTALQLAPQCWAFDPLNPQPLLHATTTVTTNPPSASNPRSTSTNLPSASTFIAYCKQLAAANKQNVIRGRDGWLFLPSELRHIGVGQFWDQRALAVSRAARPEHADPLPAILDTKAQLDALGIRLILVPVPPKALINASKLPGHLPSPSTTENNSRPDTHHKKFYSLLRQNGIEVLDLTSEFIKREATMPGSMYCRTDTHWSGEACRVTAAALATMIRKSSWYPTVPKIEFTTRTLQTTITGNLAIMPGTGNNPREQIILHQVKANGGWVRPDPTSPIILMGDSHTIVFQDGGDMHAMSSGLLSQLSKELGFRLELIGMRGSGARPTRIQLYKRAKKEGYLSNKRVIIWCFSAREFTESLGWGNIPVAKKALP